MLDQAISQLNKNEQPISHSDRGCHYRWPGWIKRMEKAGLKRSMSKKGCSPDNAACEGLFGRLKNEIFYHRDWTGVSIQKFIDNLNDYLIWYNQKRIKQSLGNMSPREYRQNLGLTA
jgi:transposase InsO family protein